MHATTPPGAAPDDLSADEFIEVLGRPGRRRLKSILIIGDAIALMLGFCCALGVKNFVAVRSLKEAAAATVVFVLAGLLCVRSQGLLLARVSSVRAVEITRITRSMGLLVAAMVVFDRVTHFGLYVRQIVIASIAAWILLVISRSVFRSWISQRRQKGLHCRRLVIIGATQETGRLAELFATHPELGIRVVGMVGDLFDTRTHAPTVTWLGELDEAEQFVLDSTASGALITSDGIAPARLNALIRNLMQRGVHVHVATGISGIASRRMQSQPLAHEPLLYIEPVRLGRFQHVMKRAFDIVVAGATLVLASPVLVVIAVTIKAHDHGPILFRQERVGHAGKLFGLFKFRTMSVDAEQRLAALVAENERRGPLFKMVDDPRVTRVGKFLRLSSLDEVPQLLNVLRGEMSLVGPRPALPAEVEKFPKELRARENVMPGITGLWQVEARDNPSFEAYRRLDLFYVENWSTTLDLIIILSTFEQLVTRVATMVFARHKSTGSPIGNGPVLEASLRAAPVAVAETSAA